MDRIANVDVPEIEITPEMIEAGASVLYGMELAIMYLTNAHHIIP